MPRLVLIFILIAMSAITVAPVGAQSSGFRDIPAYEWPGSLLEPRAFSFAGSGSACHDFYCTVVLEDGSESELRRLTVEGLRLFEWMNDEQAAEELITNSMFEVSRRQIEGNSAWEWLIEPTEYSWFALTAMTSEDPVHWEEWEIEGVDIPVPVIGGSLAILPDRHFVVIAENAQCPLEVPTSVWVDDWFWGWEFIEARFSWLHTLDRNKYPQLVCIYESEKSGYQVPIESIFGWIEYKDLAIPSTGTPVTRKMMFTSWITPGPIEDINPIPVFPQDAITQNDGTVVNMLVLPTGNWIMSSHVVNNEGIGMPVLLPDYYLDKESKNYCVPQYTLDSTDGALVLLYLSEDEMKGCYE